MAALASTREKALTAIANLQIPAQGLRRSAALWGVDNPESMSAVGPLCKELLDFVGSLTSLRTSLDAQTVGTDTYAAVEPRLPALTKMLDSFEGTMRKLQQDVETQEHAATGATELIQLLEDTMQLVKQMQSPLAIFTTFADYTEEVTQLSTSLDEGLGADTIASTRAFLRELIIPGRPEAPTVARKPLPRSVSRVDASVQTYGVDPTAPMEKSSASAILRPMETMSITDLGVEMKLIRRGGKPETTVPDTMDSQSVVPVEQPVVISLPLPTVAIEENKTETTMMVHPITGTLMPETQAIEVPKVADDGGSTNEEYKDNQNVPRPPESKPVEKSVRTAASTARAAAETQAKPVSTQESAEAKGGISFLTGPSWPFGSTNEAKLGRTHSKASQSIAATISTTFEKLPDSNPGQFLFSTNPSGGSSSNSNFVGRILGNKNSPSTGFSMPIVRKPVRKSETTPTLTTTLNTKRNVPEVPQDSALGELRILYKMWREKKYELAHVQARGAYYVSHNNYPKTHEEKLEHMRRCQNYAVASDLNGKHQEAAGAWQDVLKFSESTQGKQHADTIVAIIHIGLANERMKQINSARSYYKRAMKAAQDTTTPAGFDAYVSAWWQMLNINYDPSKPATSNQPPENLIKALESKHSSVGGGDPSYATKCFSNLRQMPAKELYDQSKNNIPLEDDIFAYAVAGDIRPMVAAILDRSPHLLYTQAIRTNIAAGAGAFGSLKVINYLYEHGFDIDTPEEDGFTALHNAVYEKRYETAKKLIEYGANVESHSNGVSPLITAIQNGNKKFVELLLGAGASLKAVPGYDWYPLLVAIAGGRLELVKFLIGKGASLDDRMAKGWDAIYLAATEEKSTDEILLTVIDRGKKQGRDLVNRFLIAPGSEQHLDNPLIGALAAKKSTRAMILMEHGADVNHKNNCNGRPLYYASHDRKLVAELIKRGADIQAKSPNGTSILSMVADFDTGERVSCLVEAGADINSSSDSGSTPLLIAVCAQNKPVVKYLLERGANVEAADSQNWRALHFAATRDGSDIVKMLLDAGAQIDAYTNKNYTAMHLSIHAKKQANFDLLMRAGATVFTQDIQGLTPLMATLQFIDNHSMFQRVITAALECGDPQKARDYINARHYEIGYVSINLAAEIGNNAAIRTLCHNGVDINSRETSRGFSPLTHAADNGHISTCEVLISLGASIFVSDPFQGGPLGRAIRHNRLDLVRLFVQKDPNLISAMNTDPGICFIEADQMDDKLEVLEYLLQQGADPNKIDHMGGTALYWANVCRRPNYLELSRILRAYGGISRHGGFPAALSGFKLRFDLFERNYQWNKNRTHFKTFLKWLDIATFLTLLGFYDDAAIAAEQALEWEYETSKDGVERRKLFEGKTDRVFSWMCEVCEKAMGVNTSARFYMCKTCRGFTICKKCYDGKMPAWEKRNGHGYVSVPREKWYTLEEGVIDIDSSGNKLDQVTWMNRIKDIKDPPPSYSEKMRMESSSSRQETIIKY